MADNEKSALFTRSLPAKPTMDDVTRQINHMQERLVIALRKKDEKIAELENRIEELEGA